MSALTKIRNVAVAIIIIGIVVTAVFWMTSKRKLEKRRTLIIKQSIDEMVKKHNAITNWDKFFVRDAKKVDNGRRFIYTIDVEDALVNNDLQPVLLYGYIADVKKVKETYFCILNMVENVDISFVLKSNSEQIKKILNQPIEDDAKDYAVVATISEIQRPKFEVDAYQDDEDEPHILVEPCDRYIANGICLDLLFVGDYDHEE